MKILIWCLTICVITSKVYGESKESTKKKSLSRKELYKYGFKVKRGEQVEGIKRILKIGDYSKRYSMVKILLEKLFKVLISAKLKVTEGGYIPGDEFPDDQEKLDDLGHVFENVAFFGDLLLRCPDITHKLYDKNQEWKIAMNWGVVFSNETDIFTGANAVMLNLVAQELEIIPRDENYVNPYKEANIKAEQRKKQKEEERLKQQKEESKQKKKVKKRRGPRLGGSSQEL
ncbi:coiled-coil domain-containing protein 134-like [Hydractinia symbiolongicarpus]|uniref:coiled-coil domain-containing protein 134-like n=1 Tax=Hydractinia symbiolongicarpus TaxID=13093 RepID=UPI00255168C0|nr:coiled-coil domain-containing protein 134-like [Hydractinia symbiolongicarpus]